MTRHEFGEGWGVEYEYDEPLEEERSSDLARVFRRAIAVGVALFSLTVFVAVAIFPNVSELRYGHVVDSAFMRAHRERGRVVRQQYVPLERISPELQRVVIASEDARFWRHRGVDYREIRAAASDAVMRGRVRGASTITQQLAKNLFLTRDRSLWRKAREIVLAKQLEAKLGKRRILELYLNVAQFGPNVFGAEAAARHYFGCSAEDVDRDEAAQLVAGLPRPESWHPGAEDDRYRARVDRLVARLR